jgi:hypothetical protein
LEVAIMDKGIAIALDTTPNTSRRHFIRHFLEMVAAMVAGMVVLGERSG